MSSFAPDTNQEKVVILVAEDDPDIQKITQLNLVQEGFEVVQAFNGLECLEKMKTASPDIILLDLMMPEMSGFETCKRLKSVDSTREVPVIVVSALEDLNDKLKCFSFKADDYVVKPYEFKNLLARIYLHLNHSMDRKERDQKQRRAILRDVMHDLSEAVAQQYQLIDSALRDAGEEIDPGTAAVIREANNEIIRVVEMTRETEDPYYESPYVETSIDYGEDEEDLAAILEDLPEPPGGPSNG
jgi:DNA-binding response OmpR family regulator